jgi:hypothetical protein
MRILIALGILGSCTSSPIDLSTYNTTCTVDEECLVVTNDACSRCPFIGVSSTETERYLEEYEAAQRLCFEFVECLPASIDPTCTNGVCQPLVPEQ